MNQRQASTTHQTLLSVLNKDVNQFNEQIADRLPNAYIHIYSHDELNESSEVSEFFKNNVTADFFNQVNYPNVPPHDPKLKVGMEGFIIRNLSPDEGLLNNTQIIIINITRSLLQVRILNTQKTFYIPRITFIMSLYHKEINLTRKQFPVRAGYVKTINRAQGATLNRTAVDLRTDCFAHGQLAVALSRVRTRKDLLILTTKDKLDENGHALTKNVVYKEILLQV